MQAIGPRQTGGAGVRRRGWVWEAPTEAIAAGLELIASEQPELLEFQTHALLNSTMGFALRKLAAAFDVPPEKLAYAVSRACADLDRLEKQRKVRWEPAEVLDKPNLAALLHVCQARLNRVQQPPRQLRLERILRRVEGAHQLARSRAWIEAFIGSPLPRDLRRLENADR